MTHFPLGLFCTDGLSAFTDLFTISCFLSGRLFLPFSAVDLFRYDELWSHDVVDFSQWTGDLVQVLISQCGGLILTVASRPSVLAYQRKIRMPSPCIGRKRHGQIFPRKGQMCGRLDGSRLAIRPVRSVSPIQR